MGLKLLSDLSVFSHTYAAVRAGIGMYRVKCLLFINGCFNC